MLSTASSQLLSSANFILATTQKKIPSLIWGVGMKPWGSSFRPSALWDTLLVPFTSQSCSGNCLPKIWHEILLRTPTQISIEFSPRQFSAPWGFSLAMTE